jgi:hypothetical protein
MRAAVASLSLPLIACAVAERQAGRAHARARAPSVAAQHARSSEESEEI